MNKFVFVFLFVFIANVFACEEVYRVSIHKSENVGYLLKSVTVKFRDKCDCSNCKVDVRFLDESNSGEYIDLILYLEIPDHRKSPSTYNGQGLNYSSLHTIIRVLTSHF